MDITKPADYFLLMDKHMVIFQNKETALFWKLDAVNTLFMCSEEIVANNYLEELRFYYKKLATMNQYKIFNKSLIAIEIMANYSKQSTFFKKRFNELKVIKESSNDTTEASIKNDYRLQELFEKIDSLLSDIRKPIFYTALNLIRGMFKHSLLFRQLKAVEA